MAQLALCEIVLSAMKERRIQEVTSHGNSIRCLQLNCLQSLQYSIVTSPRSSPVDQRNLRDSRMFTVHHEHPVRKIDPLMCDVLAIALLVS